MSGGVALGPIRTRSNDPMVDLKGTPLNDVLIVMMSAIGDAVHVLPVVSALKRHSPDCRITWVLQPGPASFVQGHPCVDEILVFHRKQGLSAFREILKELRGRRFDVLLAFQISIKAGLITAFSGVPIRLGFDRRRSRDLNFLFTTHRIPSRPDQHVQDQYFEFLRALDVTDGPVEWNIGPWPDERPAQERFYQEIDRPALPLVIATSNPEKDWVPERWAELCSVLYEEFGLQPVLAGGRSPREVAIEAIIQERARCPVVSTLGIPLRELVGLLDGAALTISLDTGPMHMSVALGRPVVSLMGYNNPKRVGPYRRFRDLIVDAYGDPGESYPITRASRRNRMSRITVAAVVEKVRVWQAKYRSDYGDGLGGRAGR
ncbi:MAG: lipopolysaccharide heptosyltransferase family protein [Gemmatimonadetes bacterium]|nr:lipopolysaccharide heptosyltransferase family protein [Gemmatimonadota bacterium]